MPCYLVFQFRTDFPNTGDDGRIFGNGGYLRKRKASSQAFNPTQVHISLAVYSTPILCLYSIHSVI